MKYFFIIAIVTTLFSCKKTNTNDNNCSSTVNSGIFTVNSSTLTANVNQEINFELLFAVINGCGISSDLETLKEGNIVTINAKTKYEGCICTQIYFEVKKAYSFKSPIAGNFKLKFNRGDNSFIEKDVVIQ